MNNNSLAWLVGRGVFNPDGSFVGKIIAYKMDANNKPTLLTQQTDDSAVEITSESVAGGKDILVLKPGFDATKAKKVALPLTDATRSGWDVGSIPTAKMKQEGDVRVCPTCGEKATWIGEYRRWYCQKERRYL
jgi:hypothetical protein